MGVSFKNEKSAIIYYHYLYNLFLCRKQNIHQNILKSAGIDYLLILMVKTGISQNSCFYAPQNQTGLEQHEGEYIMTEFKFLGEQPPKTLA